MSVNPEKGRKHQIIGERKGLMFLNTVGHMEGMRIQVQIVKPKLKDIRYRPRSKIKWVVVVRDVAEDVS